MPVNWQDVITNIGTNTVVVGAVAWVIKTVVSNRLARQAEQFRIQVKADADAEIERCGGGCPELLANRFKHWVTR
jgi:hypothetical protein